MDEQRNRDLSYHRIADVQFKAFHTRYPRLHGKNAVKGCHGFGGSVAVAVLRTDQGATGWGALCRDVGEARRNVELLAGQRLSDLLDPAVGIRDARLTPFDIALHDLAGVVLGVSVAKMLNPNAAPYARVYDGAIYMNDIIPEERPFGVEAVLRDCADDWRLGHRMFKIKIGRGHKWMAHDEGMARDVEVVRRIHAQHPGAALLVDANNGYSVDDAVRFLEEIDGIPLYWFEEPFPEEEPNDRALREYLDLHRPGTLIADGESKPDIPQLLDLARKKVLDVLQPDVCGYGFSAWRGLMRPIVHGGLMASPHAWGDVIKTEYCAHLAAAFPHHVPCVEAVVGLSEGVDDSGYVLSESMLSVPDRPGFGLDLIWGEPL